jgi:hypothetical protein
MCHLLLALQIWQWTLHTMHSVYFVQVEEQLLTAFVQYVAVKIIGYKEESLVKSL